MKIIIRTERTCGWCGKKFQGALRARWCSDACKMKAYRARRDRVTAKK